MPGPAARVTDSTAHGGLITGPGCVTVLIGGLPAARAGSDMHVCPMATPGTPPVPHVGGPISGPGVPTVLIGGLPAATVGDMAICVGPPDTIAMGCTTVLIGTAGGGGGGGGGGGAAQAAQAGAIAAVTAQPGPQAEGPHWFDAQFLDAAQRPVTEVRYEITDPDGQNSSAILTGDGKVRRGGLPKAGEFKIQLLSVYNAQWSKAEAKVGEVVELSAETEGFADGTPAHLTIWCRDLHGADTGLAELALEVQGNKIRTLWEYPASNPPPEGPRARRGYSSPEYYFIVQVQQERARSGQLKFQDALEIELKDQDDQPIADERYLLHLANGEVRQGRLDRTGTQKEEKLPPGPFNVEFPDIKGE